MRYRYSSVAIVCAALIASFFTPAAAQVTEGSRPRDLAVSSIDLSSLTTSFGSTSVVHHAFTGTWNRTEIPVTYKSWGVCFVEDGLLSSRAVVTHPFTNHMTILTRSRATGSDPWPAFTDVQAQLGDEFYYLTDVIPSPESGRVLVACGGLAPGGEDEWRDAVYEFDVSGATPILKRTFVCERGPRSMVVSPDGTRLFVGHIQGDMYDITDATDDRDGGSILVFKLDDGLTGTHYETRRKFVGSAVRGLAIYTPTNGNWRLYYTHLGDGANGEDPDDTAAAPFYGRETPNVISSVEFVIASDDWGDTQDTYFGHRPDQVPGDPFSTVYPVLPEKLAVRQNNGAVDLLVINSGSGSVSRANILAASGKIRTKDPTNNEQRTMVRLDRSGTSVFTSTEQRTFEIIEDVVAGDHVDLTRAGSLAYTSNPRAIEYVPLVDRAYVITQFDNQLIPIVVSGGTMQIENGPFFTTINLADPIGNTTSNIGPPTNFATNPDPAHSDGDERRFYTFGYGFAFRENVFDAVGNIACSSCHVDGNTDGKVRITRLARDGVSERNASGGNLPEGSNKPVVTPSIFDVGKTEWLFFDGLKTIRDLAFFDVEQCGYCVFSGFFLNTVAFTTFKQSPVAPAVSNGALNAAQRRGRYVFESMNCSRCHTGATGVTFDRSNEPDAPMTTDDTGPVPQSLVSSNRLLHDPTQSFVTEEGASGSGEDIVSLRNTSHVGTRIVQDGIRSGINTPPLANAWNNAPFMHDGRYRELQQVLDNTWLFDDSQPATYEPYMAADLVMTGLPDNAQNRLDMTADPPENPEKFNDGQGFTRLFRFGTHEHFTSGGPSAKVSVGAYLSGALFSGYAGDPADDLKAFLFSLSSQTDPCAGGDDLFANQDWSRPTLTFNTSVPVACDILWGPQGNPTNVAQTDRGLSHQITADVTGYTTLVEFRVTARMRTVCGDPVTATWLFHPGKPGGPPPEYEETPAPIFHNQLVQNHPNPFNPSTTIEYALVKQSTVAIRIFDVRGRLVRTLLDEAKPRGWHSVVWDGTDNKGNHVASGTYFYRMATDNFADMKKLVLLK